MICGTKTRIPLNPATTPFMRRSLHHASGNAPDKAEPSFANASSIQSIGKGALTGALILGGIGAILGLLVGLNIIHIPSLDPSAAQALPFQITWQYIFTSVVTGMIFGGITGAILGAATRLAMPQYRKVDTAQEASKGDLLLAVEADDPSRVNKVMSTMQEYGAVSYEEFKDQWDPEVWSVLNEETPQVR